MKHLKSEQLQWEKRKQRQRFFSSQKRKNKKYDTNTPGKSFSNTVLGYKILKVPTKLLLYNIDDEQVYLVSATFNFFDTLRQTIGQKKILIDFSDTIRIDAAALLVMYAIAEEGIKKSAVRVRYSLPTTSKNVKSQLRKSYFLKLLNRVEIDSPFNSKKMLPVVTGVGNDKIDELVDYLLEKVFEEATPEQEYIYADAISETVHNVGLHAYPDKKDDEKKWWLLSQVIENQLYLAIYDTGVGIPKTVVKQSYFFGKLKDAFPSQFKSLMDRVAEKGSSQEEIDLIGSNIYSMGLLSDEQAIHLSLRPDITGTRKDKHGQGSKSIKKLVEETRNGRLWVMSNKGAFVKEQSKEASLHALPGDLKGTLVQWNIQLR